MLWHHPVSVPDIQFSQNFLLDLSAESKHESFSLSFSEICMFSSTELATSAQTRSWRVPLNYEPSSHAWTVLIAYTNAKFKSNDDETSYRSNYVSFCPANFLSIDVFVGAVTFRALKCFALQGPFCKAGQTWIRKKKTIALHVRIFVWNPFCIWSITYVDMGWIVSFKHLSAFQRPCYLCLPFADGGSKLP
jgi:hypothetical protein